MKKLCLVVALLTAISTSVMAQSKTELSFIDHFNLRRMKRYDEARLKQHVQTVKKNLDKAKALGITNYILFSRSFEGLINYDFSVDGLGDLTGKIFAMDTQHRREQKIWSGCVNDVIEYADKLGIKVIVHTNQFEFPKPLYAMAGDKIGGTARVCPGKQMCYDVLKAKIREFFTHCPKCAGIQLTISESQVKPTDCKCEACKDLSDGERFKRIAQAAVDACKPLGKTVMIRTWGEFDTVENVLMLPKEIICSTKCTDTDFFLCTVPSKVIGINADKQEVEFDAWGEYFGYNLFPCYIGDYIADCIKLASSRGVTRFAIRLNWEPGEVNDIFSRPFGNEVNTYLFARLGKDPSLNADDVLREYIAKTYPESARDVAFRLYKRSFDIQSTWMTWQNNNCNDHSMIYNGDIHVTGFVNRVRKQIGHAIPEDYDTARQLLESRRNAVDKAYTEAIALIKALGPDVPDAWKKEMERGARTQWFVAQGNCDCMLMYAAYREVENKRPLPDISVLEKGIQQRASIWQKTDPEMFTLMLGDGTFKMLKQIKTPPQSE